MNRECFNKQHPQIRKSAVRFLPIAPTSWNGQTQCPFHELGNTVAYFVKWAISQIERNMCTVSGVLRFARLLRFAKLKFGTTILTINSVPQHDVMLCYVMIFLWHFPQNCPDLWSICWHFYDRCQNNPWHFQVFQISTSHFVRVPSHAH